MNRGKLSNLTRKKLKGNSEELGRENDGGDEGGRKEEERDEDERYWEHCST